MNYKQRYIYHLMLWLGELRDKNATGSAKIPAPTSHTVIWPLWTLERAQQNMPVK